MCITCKTEGWQPASRKILQGWVLENVSDSLRVGPSPPHLSKVLSNRNKCLVEVGWPRRRIGLVGAFVLWVNTKCLSFLWSQMKDAWRGNRWQKKDRMHEWLVLDEDGESTQQRVLNMNAHSEHDSCQGWCQSLKVVPTSYAVVLHSTGKYSFPFFLLVFINFFFKKAIQKIYIVRNREVNNTSTYGSFQLRCEDGIGFTCEWISMVYETWKEKKGAGEVH